MASLFPTFDVPKVIENENKTDNRQKSSLYFDFELGDFALEKTGDIKTASPYDAWVQWCLKTVYTQRWAFLAYSSQTGVEMEEAFWQETRPEQQSYMESTIIEALLADPYSRTKRVYDFDFQWKTDSVDVTFVVSGIWDQDAPIKANLKKRG